MFTIQEEPKSQKSVSVTLSWEEWEPFMTHAIEAIAKKIKVEGFRPGKAPRDVVEREVGTDALLQEAADRAMQKQWEHLVKEHSWEVIGRPKGEITKVAEGNDLEFTIRFSHMPVVTLAKGWQKAVSKANASSAKQAPKVEESAVQKDLERIAVGRAKLVTVARDARMGDAVIVDFQVFRDGVAVENGSGNRHPIVLGSGVFVPGFEEALVGMRDGDEKKFTLTFPKEYHDKALAGQPAEFHAVMHEVQERNIPVLDDAFAQSLGTFDTLDALKTSVREGMEEEERRKTKENTRAAITEVLAANVNADIPDVLLEEELHSMVHNLESQLSMTGTDLEGYLTQIKKTREDLEKDWKPQAEKRILSGLAIGAIVKEREIEASAEEIETEMNKTLARYKNLKDAEKKANMQKLYGYAKNVVVSEKAFEYLETV